MRKYKTRALNLVRTPLEESQRSGADYEVCLDKKDRNTAPQLVDV